MLVRWSLVFVLILTASACSPDYDWRQVSVSGGAVQAAFPDRPKSQTRTLNFEGHELSFEVTAARVQGTLFAIGYAALPPAVAGDPVLREEIGRRSIRSLYQNAGASPPPALPAAGERFSLLGHGARGDVKVEATVWTLEHALVEAVVTADAGAFPETAADDFFRSVVLGR